MTHAVNLLRPLGALSSLTRDFDMVSRLISKLPVAYQSEWDRHITSIITPRQYQVEPQGSMTSADGFCYWYDTVFQNLPRKRKCIYHFTVWADTMADTMDMAEFLILTLEHRIVQNAKKFVWNTSKSDFG